MDRRSFLTIGAVGAVGAVLPASADAAESFSFVHFTDVHIQPELHAGEGTRRCIARINASRTRDLRGRPRVRRLPWASRANRADLRRIIKPPQAPLHTIVGNHDVFGISTTAASFPIDVRQAHQDRIGPLYSSFDHKGWHFVLLDSIRTALGRVRGHQRRTDRSLKKDRRDETGLEVVVVTHIPLVSGVLLVPAPAARRTSIS
jgi:3',5'-cyclic AMP phosphodiesterase CpdA